MANKFKLVKEATYDDVIKMSEKIKVNNFYFINHQSNFDVYIRDLLNGIRYDGMDTFMGTGASDIYSDFLIQFNNMALKYIQKPKLDCFKSAIKILFILNKSNFKNSYFGGLFYKSYCESFFSKSDDLYIREKFENYFLKHRNLLQVYKDEKHLDDIEFKKINEYFKKIKPKIVEKIQKNEIVFEQLDFILKSSDNRLKQGEFQKKITENSELLHLITTNENVLAQRLIVIYTYLYLLNIGINSKELYLCCYLVYRTLEVGNVDYDLYVESKNNISRNSDA